MTTTNHLDELEARIKARYVSGEMSRPVYQSELATVHAAKAHAYGSGPCRCGACLADREAHR